MIVVRPKPERCNHQFLAECPLDVEDWEKVFLALIGFRQQCAVIADQAHERAERTARPTVEPEGDRHGE